MQHPADRLPRLCFVSYPPLSRLARSVMAEFAGRAEIELVEASFDSAVAAAQARERGGRADAFVSAGSNGRLLREALAAPVALIDVDGYDILLALQQASRVAARIGVVTYGETIAELERIRPLLNAQIEQRAYRLPHEAEARIDELRAAGVEVIVGSSLPVEAAERRGMHGVLAYSPAAVRQGLETALEMARVARLESARHEQLRALLASLSEAVLAVDDQHRISAANAAMEALLGQPLAALRGQDLEQLAPALRLSETLRSGSERRGQPLHWAGRDWVANRSPLLDQGRVAGAVIVLYDAEDIATADSRLRAQRQGRRRQAPRHRFDDLLGEDPAFRQTLDTARRYAGTDLTVLLSGETGTGKELFAQALHAASRRAARPFVALNCSALPEPLLESELFGHEEGAFTGARRGGRAGLFEAAHTGTLFLDEIGDMPVTLQTRLLRVLQEREVMRLGGTTPVPVDVRIVAATHQDLPALIAQGRFRQDLYYRLNLLRLALPPLRARGDDLLPLARGTLARTLAELGSTLDAEAVLRWAAPLLRRHAWPGNVRELHNVCTRLAVFVAPWPTLDGAGPERLLQALPELRAMPDAAPAALTPAEALRLAGGRRAAAAALLGISRATLWRRLREAGPG